MPLPPHVRSILEEVGQVAAEVPCAVEECREFVAVYATPTGRVINNRARFAYLGDIATLYRVRRFRVRAELIEADAQVSPDDLADHQEIVLPSEEAVAFILSL